MTRPGPAARGRGIPSVRGFWTARRAPLWLVTAAVLAWLPLLTMPARHWTDFASFYAAGKLAFTPQLADLHPVINYETTHGLAPTPFLYPPALALVYVPFTWLPYGLAAAIHVILQAAALLGAAVLGSRLYGIPRRWAILGTLAWSPAVAGVISGQNSAVLLLLAMMAAAGLSGGRWRLAGLALGAAAYRPQQGLPLIGLAAWRGSWRPVAIAGGLILVQYGLGVIASGGLLSWPAHWVASIVSETAIDFQAVGWQALSLPGLLGRLSVNGSAEGALLGPALVGYVIGGLVIMGALRPLRTWDAPGAVALACALALFAGPRGWSYDGTMLLPAVAVLARDAGSIRRPWAHGWLLAGAYALALSWPVGVLIGVNPEAAVVLAAPFVLLRWGPFSRLALASARGSVDALRGG